MLLTSYLIPASISPTTSSTQHRSIGKCGKRTRQGPNVVCAVLKIREYVCMCKICTSPLAQPASRTRALDLRGGYINLSSSTKPISKSAASGSCGFTGEAASNISSSKRSRGGRAGGDGHFEGGASDDLTFRVGVERWTGLVIGGVGDDDFDVTKRPVSFEWAGETYQMTIISKVENSI